MKRDVKQDYYDSETRVRSDFEQPMYKDYIRLYFKTHEKMHNTRFLIVFFLPVTLFLESMSWFSPSFAVP